MKRFWPLALLLAGLGLAWASGATHWLSWDALAANRAWLAETVAMQPLASGLGFVALYAVVVAFSLPVAVWLTLAGGFLFGQWLGTALVVAGATAGACLLFLAARYALAESLARKAGPLLAKVRQGLETGGFWYLLSLRLLPVVPFWLANLAPAVAGMRFAPFALATLVGIIPGSAVFCGIGAGLGEVFASGGRPDLKVIFSPQILLPLLGLAALSLVGAWWRGRKPAHG
jgi:uncharacterized membrane protein YdjX (TVP38/TMEM64 family)